MADRDGTTLELKAEKQGMSKPVSKKTGIRYGNINIYPSYNPYKMIKAFLGGRIFLIKGFYNLSIVIKVPDKILVGFGRRNKTLGKNLGGLL